MKKNISKDAMKYTFAIHPRGFCEHYAEAPDRLLSVQECWFCKYGEFGIRSDKPTKEGLCMRGSSLVHSYESKTTIDAENITFGAKNVL